MITRYHKLALTAGFVLALALTFSCSSDDGNDNPPPLAASGVSSGSGSGCTASNNTSTHYCSNGTMKTYGSTPEVGGRTYKTVIIGAQTWMAENLNYNASGSKCGRTDGYLTNENTPTCATYGRLYDWETAKTVCPSGWRLPSNEEWTTLVNSVGGSYTAGTKLKAANGWRDGSNNNGTDEFGFSALPGGRGYSDGDFYYVGLRGFWWSATDYSASYAYSRYMYYFSAYVDSYGDVKSSLFSVRCVQDKA